MNGTHHPELGSDARTRVFALARFALPFLAIPPGIRLCDLLNRCTIVALVTISLEANDYDRESGHSPSDLGPWAALAGEEAGGAGSVSPWKR
ncbi:MAG: hypothetical protein U0031_02190 [Thermomicrobiales bacterium]